MNRFLPAILAVTCLVAAVSAHGGDPYPRQYYGGWNYQAKSGYYYRPYYYKPAPTYHGYKHHYVTYHPKRDTKHYYYYNPYTKKYWGRCPTTYGETASYSLLAEADRHAVLDQIPEKSFPKPGPLPPLPDAKDDISLDLPPDDLPPEAAPVAPAAPALAPGDIPM